MLKPKKHLKNQEIYKISPKFEKWEMRLNANENVFDLSPKVVNAIKNIDFDRVKYYPVYEELKELLANNYNLRNLKYIICI